MVGRPRIELSFWKLISALLLSYLLFHENCNISAENFKVSNRCICVSSRHFEIFSAELSRYFFNTNLFLRLREAYKRQT